MKSTGPHWKPIRHVLEKGPFTLKLPLYLSPTLDTGPTVHEGKLMPAKAE